MLVLPLAIPSEKGLQKHAMLLLPSLGAYKSQLLQKKNRPNIRMARESSLFDYSNNKNRKKYLFLLSRDLSYFKKYLIIRFN